MLNNTISKIAPALLIGIAMVFIVNAGRVVDPNERTNPATEEEMSINSITLSDGIIIKYFDPNLRTLRIDSNNLTTLSEAIINSTLEEIGNKTNSYIYFFMTSRVPLVYKIVTSKVPLTSKQEAEISADNVLSSSIQDSR